jgi:hypothetical protein
MHSSDVPNNSMGVADEIRVEVVYASPARQRLLTIHVPSGTTVAEAIRRCGILNEFPEIDLARVGVGIFSRRVSLEHVLRADDRIEIYRPLLADPKSARRVRARGTSAKEPKPNRKNADRAI